MNSLITTLSVSIVTYKPDIELLYKTVSSLRKAVLAANEKGVKISVVLDLIDNNPDAKSSPLLSMILMKEWKGSGGGDGRVISGHGNVGYGRGHNLGILQRNCDYHLILNPDVLLEEGALWECISYMDDNPEVGMLSPLVTNEFGLRQYACFREPTLAVLFLRGFVPNAIKSLFKKMIDRYEMKELSVTESSKVVKIISGCFMFVRTSVLKKVNGFSDSYFLYFEDFDLSLRIGSHAPIAFVPDVRVVHYGGNAAKKGLGHIKMFLRSAFTFFSHYGWRVI
jgi:GT2 family glycosyltransferase